MKNAHTMSNRFAALIAALAATAAAAFALAAWAASHGALVPLYAL